MGVVFLVTSLALHALQDDCFDIILSDCSSVEEGKQGGERPRLETVPHLKHGSRAKGDKVGKRIVEEEGLVVFIVMRATEAGLVKSVWGIMTSLKRYLYLPEKYQ